MEKNIKYLGIDDGHYALKICYELNNELKTLSLPSRIAYGFHQLSSLDGIENNDNCMYTANDITYTVLEKYNELNDGVIDLRNLNYPTSDVNAILIYHALTRAGFNSDDHLRIVTGLPFKEFYLNGTKNIELINKKRKNLDRSIICKDKKVSLPHIDFHNVLSEGAGAFIDIALDFNGNPNTGIIDSIKDAPMSIVDIGGKTTDIITMDTGGKKIRINESNTAFIGALNLNELIGIEICKKLKLGQYSATEIETALKTGTYFAQGQKHDVTNIVIEQKKVFARKIVLEVRKVLKDASHIGIVAFVGGGSLLIQKELKEDRERFIKKDKFLSSYPIEKIDLKLELLENQKSMIVENMDLLDFRLKI